MCNKLLNLVAGKLKLMPSFNFRWYVLLPNSIENARFVLFDILIEDLKKGNR